jgi:predicted DsbA family dithiol-disulfide isomerase
LGQVKEVSDVAIQIRIFSDYIWPYCYIGTGIVDKLKEEFPLEDTWISYEIHPETPPQGILLERLFGPGIVRSQEGQRQRCTELGLPFEAPRLLSNSRLAVEAAEFARDAGKHAEFHRAVLAAYFARSEDVGDVEVLAGLAEQVGLDPVRLRGELSSGAHAGRREAAGAEAARAAVTGVPTYIFAAGARVVGAQSLDHFRRLLESIAATSI